MVRGVRTVLPCGWQVYGSHATVLGRHPCCVQNAVCIIGLGLRAPASFAYAFRLRCENVAALTARLENGRITQCDTGGAWNGHVRCPRAVAPHTGPAAAACWCLTAHVCWYAGKRRVRGWEGWQIMDGAVNGGTCSDSIVYLRGAFGVRGATSIRACFVYMVLWRTMHSFMCGVVVLWSDITFCICTGCPIPAPRLV